MPMPEMIPTKKANAYSKFYDEFRNHNRCVAEPDKKVAIILAMAFADNASYLIEWMCPVQTGVSCKCLQKQIQFPMF